MAKMKLGDVQVQYLSKFDYTYLSSYVQNKRVPCGLRSVNPEAYTPQMLIIGPLHHYKKAQAVELSRTDVRYMYYNKMELHKKKYLENFALAYGNQTVEKFRSIIKRDEQVIRSCYAESTDTINSDDFVEMMLHDSVFLLVFFMHNGPRYIDKTGDFLFDEPCYQYTIFGDLILLENQLPYALLESLFEPFYDKFGGNITFRDVILQGFGIQGKVTREKKFLHFTDLRRLVLVQTLGLTEEEQINAKLVRKESIVRLPNAEMLNSAGVEFECSEEKDTLVIEFERGILTMPCFKAEDNTERVFRSIMALEQCHYPYTAFVCNYIDFLVCLIETESDVDVLVNKGVIKNWLGRKGYIAEMVSRLCLEIVDEGCHYYDISERLSDFYENPFNRSVATLRRVYFKDLWTGTAHVVAFFLLVLTLIATVASVLQVTQKDNNS
ncbi:hypothetical protein Rs2_32090 [Raphanus sativus]|nr:hypothetical protein Rs2_32090 [Raphanus sativus]